ncbi:MAG: hypothetical protein RBT63_08795, partial [Bdellovibrionales bacterium]|nr:hypothetical protein [Bdellovibrionales bacterium]
MARILDFADGFESNVEPPSTNIPAETITFEPGSGLTSTNVQGAIEELASQKEQPGGLASLDGNGKVPVEQIPAIAVTSVHVVADIPARDLLEVEEGDVCKVLDDGNGNQATYIFDGSTWQVMQSDAALAMHAAEKNTHGVSGDIVGTTDIQVVTNKDIDGGAASNTHRLTVPKATKAALDALTRKEATFVYATDQKKAFIDDGSKLVPVGSGSGSGGVNFIQNGDAEEDVVAPFVTYKDAASAVPEDATGGTPAITLEVSDVNPISGTRSFVITKPASNCQGEGASVDFTIDRARLAKLLMAVLDFANSSGFTTGDLALFVINKTTGQKHELGKFDAHGLPSMPKLAMFNSDVADQEYRLALHIT